MCAHVLLSTAKCYYHYKVRTDGTEIRKVSCGGSFFFLYAFPDDVVRHVKKSKHILMFKPKNVNAMLHFDGASRNWLSCWQEL